MTTKEQEILRAIENFSFGERGSLRFYHEKFQEGYLQAIKDIDTLLKDSLKGESIKPRVEIKEVSLAGLIMIKEKIEPKYGKQWALVYSRTGFGYMVKLRIVYKGAAYQQYAEITQEMLTQSSFNELLLLIEILIDTISKEIDAKAKQVTRPTV